MSAMPGRPVAASPVAARVAGAPAVSEDGRPFTSDQEPDDEAALWTPDPPRDGDPVYCCGVRVGTFSGDCQKPGGWYIETVPTCEMPSKLAQKVRLAHRLATAWIGKVGEGIPDPTEVP